MRCFRDETSVVVMEIEMKRPMAMNNGLGQQDRDSVGVLAVTKMLRLSVLLSMGRRGRNC